MIQGLHVYIVGIRVKYYINRNFHLKTLCIKLVISNGMDKIGEIEK
jgi:hypothetical protein